MKFSIDRESLLKPLQAVQGVVERRQTLPILSNLLVTVQEGAITFTATAMEVEMVARTGAIGAEGNEITLPARKLVDICRSLPAEAKVDLTVEGDRATVKSGRSRFTLSTLPAGEFPTTDTLTDETRFSVNQGELKQLIELTQYAMAQQDVRYYLNGLRVEFALEDEDQRFRSRFDWLEEICAGKRIVHAGCVDHSEAQIRKKLKKHKWLHARLCARAERCHGVDKDAAGIQFIRDQLGYTDVDCVDLIHGESDIIRAGRWDFLVLAEVLEHMDNPVDFLASIKSKYAGQVSSLIITVPNAFARENFLLAKQGVEAINTDHRYWFTPYTLVKVVFQAGLHPGRLLMCRNGIVKKRSVVKNARMRRQPFLRNNIILVAGLQGESKPATAPA